MEIFKTKDGKTITYDNNRASVVDVKELLLQKSDIEGRISESTSPEDKELLEWARNNYPIVDNTAEVAELAKIDTILSSLKTDISIEEK